MNMKRALAASISVAEKWTTKENVLWLPFFGKFRQRNHPHVSAPHHALFLPVSTNVFYFYTNFISRTPLLRIFYSWSKHKRIRTVGLRQYSGSLAHPKGMYYNGKEGRKEPLCLAYISRLKPTKVFVWQYNNKRRTLRYRVHYATKVFDARTLRNKSFSAQRS